MRTNRLFWLISLCSALAMGCDDDARTINAPDVDEGGPVEDPNTDPDPIGDPDDQGTEVSPIEDDGTDESGDPDPGVTCDEICEVGTSRCTEGGSQLCERINECPQWGKTTQCQCNSNTGECATHCDNPCTANEKKCDNKAVWTCVMGDDTCTHWEQTQNCSDTEICENAQCITGCSDECQANDVRCHGSSMQKCALNAAGCMVWQDDTACPENQICSKDGTKCEYACGDDCDPFSIVLIPDTQYYTQSSALGHKDAKGNKVTTKNSLMTKQMEWIENNKDKDKKNIRFVIHLGDITNANREQEWKDSTVSMKLLAKAGVPFSISTGNHDYVKSDVLLPSRGSSKFTKYYTAETLKDFFAETPLSDMKWFGEYKLGANSYSTFSVGNLNFLVFGFEFYPRKDVIAWADSILNKPEFADYHVIVETHGYVCFNSLEKCAYCGQQKQASTHYQVQGMGGQALFDEFIKRHSNIFMGVGGHSPGSKYMTHENLFGTTVHELLVDYQMESPCQSSSCSNGTCAHNKVNSGNGWFRLLTIDPKTGDVTGETISVVGKDKAFYGTSKPSQHLFCKERYTTSATDPDHINHFKIDVTPAKHQYSDEENYGFMPRDLNNEGSGDQLNPRVAMHSSGWFVGTWEDNSSTDDGDDLDVSFRLFKRGGYANGGQKFVTKDNKSAKGNQKTPDIAMDKDGTFVIVWADNASKNYDIKMARFNSNGEIISADLIANEVTDGDQTNPQIAMAPDGRFAVVWNDKQGSANINAKYRLFNADGQPNGSEQYVIGKTNGTRRNPAIGMDASGNFAIAWDDDADDNGAYQMHAQKYDSTGKAIGDVLVVNDTAAGQQLHGAVGMNSKGAFFVAYRDDRDKDKKYAIRIRGWDENLKELITDKEVYSSSHDNAQPTVCVDDSNRAFVGFYDSDKHNSVTKNGKKTTDSKSGDVLVGVVYNGKVSKISSATSLVWNNQKMPDVACTGDGRLVVVYADDADKNGAYETYVRGFNNITDFKFE